MNVFLVALAAFVFVWLFAVAACVTLCAAIRICRTVTDWLGDAASRANDRRHARRDRRLPKGFFGEDTQ